MQSVDSYAEIRLRFLCMDSGLGGEGIPGRREEPCGFCMAVEIVV